MRIKAIITDYNRLPFNLEECELLKYFDDYLIYDRFHRFEESDKIKHQVDVGVNIYDIFDFIITNYDNLPDISIFIKDDVVPRHCSKEKFEKIIHNTTFTPIENYIRETPRYKAGIYSFVSDNDEYYEAAQEVDYQVRAIHFCKYIFTYRELLHEIFENPEFGYYIKFAPGGNYLIPKENILKYNIDFYKQMRHYVAWAERPGEAYLFERAMCVIFNSNFNIKDKYKK